MLWNAASLSGFTIEANDGQIGTVHDLLFDDADWVIRWLVVDTGYGATARKVLLPVSALGVPDASSRRFPVDMTTAEIDNSPDIALDLPVSRQIEETLYGAYGWTPYWQNNGGIIGALIVKPLQSLQQKTASHGDPGGPPQGGDPHLRSVAVVTQYHINAQDGDIGHIDDFLVQDDNWTIRYLIIDTQNWWPGEKVLISPGAMRDIRWESKIFHLNVSRAAVKASPEFDPCSTAEGAYDDQFLTYFGINWVKK